MCNAASKRALAAGTKERTRQGWVIPSSAYVCARVCMCVCTSVHLCRAVWRECCSVWKYTHSSFNPTSSSNESSASMQSSDQSTSQTLAIWAAAPAEACVRSPAAIAPSTPVQMYLPWRQFPKRRQGAATPHPLPLTWLTPPLSLCFGGNLNIDLSPQPRLILPRCNDTGLENSF